MNAISRWNFPRLILFEKGISQTCSEILACLLNKEHTKSLIFATLQNEYQITIIHFLCSPTFLQLSPESPELLQASRSKHPSPTTTLRLPDPDNIPLSTTNADEVLSAVVSVNPKLLYWRPWRTRTATLQRHSVWCHGGFGQGAVSQTCMSSKSDAFRQSPPVHHGNCVRGTLCALRKKDGGIKSIALGCTIRLIVSKICVRQCSMRLLYWRKDFGRLNWVLAAKEVAKPQSTPLRTYLMNK